MTSNSEIINNVEEQGGKPFVLENNSLNRFIKKYRVKKNSTCTHRGLEKPQLGCFLFGKNDIDEFYINYGKQKVKHIAEIRQPYSQFLVDIDIKKTKEQYEDQLWLDNKFYTIEQVKSFIKVCQEQIKKIYTDIEEIQLDAVLLEKDMYQKNENTWSGGLHIQFPNLYVKTETIKNSLIPSISEELKKIEGMPKEFVVMDIPAMCTASWLLYGGTKSVDSKPYLISKIFNNEQQEMTVEKRLLEYKIYDTEEEPIILTSKNLEKNLPRILSINPSHRIVNEIDKKHDNQTPPVVKEKKEKKEYIDNRPLDEIRNEVKKLLSCLSQNRVDDQYQWKCVGWCLYNISDGDDEFFDMWNEWSEKSDKYVGEDDCRQYWKSTDHEKYNMGSLKWMARKDNEQMYFDVLKINKNDDNICIFLNLLIKGLPDLECAETFYEFNKDSIFYSKSCGYIMFNEMELLWQQDCEKNEILTLISKFYREKIEGECSEQAEEIRRQQLIKQIDECEDKKQKKKLQTKLDNVGKEIRASHNRIQSSKWAFGVLHHVDNLFKKNHKTEHISQHLDNIDYLYPMGKYVINFKTREIRPRKFEDYFTYTNDTEYIPVEERNTSAVISYMKQILGTEDLDYVKNAFQIFATNLCGENPYKKIIFLLGGSDHGKSLFIELNGSCNKSQVKAPERAFIKKPSESVMQLELSCMEKKRCAILQEPDEGEKLNESTMKQFSGDDKTQRIRAGSNSKYTEIVLRAKLFVVLNAMMPIKDKVGMANRRLTIDFPTKFEKNENRKKEILELKNHYFSHMVDILYELYEINFQITFCKQMIDSTNRENLAQDSLKQFIDQNIEFTENVNDRMSGIVFKELYSTFCNYNELIKESAQRVDHRLRKEYNYADENRKTTTRTGVVYFFMREKRFVNNIEMVEDDGIPLM